MPGMTEDLLETTALAWFAELGYQTFARAGYIA